MFVFQGIYEISASMCICKRSSTFATLLHILLIVTACIHTNIHVYLFAQRFYMHMGSDGCIHMRNHRHLYGIYF